MKVEIAVSAVLIFVVLFFALSGKKRKRDFYKSPSDAAPDAGGGGKICPLCDSLLLKGEKVRSVLYPALPGEKDSIMEVMGCPMCYPPNPLHKRICPVCGKEVPYDGTVTGRYFRREGKKDHLHILGCPLCRKKS